MNDLILLVKDYIHNQTSSIIVTDELLQYAKIHQLEGIVYHQCKDDRLQSIYMYQIYNYRNRLKCVEDIKEILHQANIPYFFVKGIEVSNCYRHPHLKTMGDCDLTVHIDDKDIVADLLIQNGFVEKNLIKDREHKSEWHLYKNDLLFELHHALLYGNEAGETVNDNYLEYFSHCWDYVEDNYLNDNYHLLYLLVHLRKHFMNKGIGLRQFLDIAFFSQKKLNWDWITQELEKLDLLLFSKNVYGLINRWWDLQFPLTIDIDDLFFEKSTTLILNAGVFGFENDDGTNNMINKANNGQNIRLQKIKFLFPSYKDMYSSDAYKSLKGKPYLLPAYWIYRAYRYKMEYKQKTNKFNIDKSKIDERNRVLKDWNLL